MRTELPPSVADLGETDSLVGTLEHGAQAESPPSEFAGTLEHVVRTEPPASVADLGETDSLVGTPEHEAQTEPSPSELEAGLQPAQTSGLSRHFASGSQVLMHTTRFRHQRSCPPCYSRTVAFRGGF